jgi:hypothetical protein
MQNVNVIYGRVCVVRAFRKGGQANWTVREYLNGGMTTLPKTATASDVCRTLCDWALIHGDGFDRVDAFEETSSDVFPINRKAG